MLSFFLFWLNCDDILVVSADLNLFNLFTSAVFILNPREFATASMVVSGSSNVLYLGASRYSHSYAHDIFLDEKLTGIPGMFGIKSLAILLNLSSPISVLPIPTSSAFLLPNVNGSMPSAFSAAPYAGPPG